MTYRSIEMLNVMCDQTKQYPVHRQAYRLMTLKCQKTYITRLWGYRAREVR